MKKVWQILVCESGVVRTHESEADARDDQNRLTRRGLHGIIGVSYEQSAALDTASTSAS